MSSDDDDVPLAPPSSRTGGRSKRKVCYVESDDSDANFGDGESDEMDSDVEQPQETKSQKSRKVVDAKETSEGAKQRGGAKATSGSKAAKSKVGVVTRDPAGEKLKNAAMDSGMMCATVPVETAASKPSKEIQAFDGLDLIKKSGGRKKYLFLFPGRINELRAGRVGDISQMDTQNPVAYIDWAGEGRLKLKGTIVHPKAKTLLLKKEKVKGSDGIVCDQVFETIVVFSDISWVGKPEENPTESPMAFPPKEIAGKRAAPKPKPEAAPADSDGRRSGRARTGPKSYAEPSDRIEDDDDDDDSDESEGGRPAVTKQRAPKRVKKEEPSAGDNHDGAEEEKDDADDAASSGSDILERFVASQSSKSPTQDVTSYTDFGMGVRPSKSPQKSEAPKWSGWDSDDSD